MAMDWTHPDFTVSAVDPRGIVYGLVRPRRGDFREADRLVLNGNGVLPVAVLATASFDPASLDVETIRLSVDGEGGAAVARRGNGAPMASAEDVNGDGLADLLLHFRRADLRSQVTASTTRLVLRGTTGAGVEVEGEDAVRPK